MVLCDIGNTNARILAEGSLVVKPVDEFLKLDIQNKVHYICVNDSVKAVLDTRANFVDMEPHIGVDTKYVNMGIDRICACKSAYDGVVVDAGSAITVDIMKKGVHAGGFILPGFKAYETACRNISPRLDEPMNFDIQLKNLPQNTRDAVSYAYLKSIFLIIDSVGKYKKIYFTGGSGKNLSLLFRTGVYDEMLIFKTLEQTFYRLYRRRWDII